MLQVEVNQTIIVISIPQIDYCDYAKKKQKYAVFMKNRKKLNKYTQNHKTVAANTSMLYHEYYQNRLDRNAGVSHAIQ